MNRPESIRVLVNETKEERAARERIATLRKGVESLSMAGFGVDFAEARVERELALKRARSEPQYATFSKEQLDAIYGEAYPQHTMIARDALQGIGLHRTRNYTEIDRACDAICCAVAERLERRLDAHRFPRDYAEEKLTIPGLGELKVRISQAGDGIFTSIESIEGDSFKIWNCRFTGRRYLGDLNDISAPHDILIKPLNIELTLYGDESGISLKKNGIKYTNQRVRSIGIGYASDCLRDELWPDRDNFEERDGNADLIAKAKAVPQRGKRGYFGEIAGFARNETLDEYREFMKQAGYPFELSFKRESGEVTTWLREAVLARILATPPNKLQAVELPAPIAVPAMFQSLYTWVDGETRDKIAVFGERNENVNLNAQSALTPGWRLVPYGEGRSENLPEIAYEGMIWCGIGDVKPNSPPSGLEIPGFQDNGRAFDSTRYLVQITPRDAAEIFIVNYADEYNHVDAAKTLVPITNYKGGFGRPTVLISRPVTYDEVEIVAGVVKGEKRRR